MLVWHDGSAFAAGRSYYLDADPAYPSADARIHVRVAFGGVSVLALMDTGAAWSVLNVEVAEELELLDAQGELLAMSTRIGLIEGNLVRTPATLVAEDGDSVDVDSTVLVSQEWRQPTVIGYSGLLERVRFAIDPDTRSFVFGAR